jgi:hypothetical protein
VWYARKNRNLSLCLLCQFEKGLFQREYCLNYIVPIIYSILFKECENVLNRLCMYSIQFPIYEHRGKASTSCSRQKVLVSDINPDTFTLTEVFCGVL